jgi:hypothetical protein
LLNGYRRGHRFTISLCPWHHRGIRPNTSRTVRETREMLGPSLALTPTSFTLHYGTDDELLALQNTLVDKWQEDNVCAIKGNGESVN